ncbi:MAG TPA: hypothetical protein VJ798_04640 [Rhizomicrobium sp.]|nr:hypothetical protein [Rhizomicrobium sp.]
MKAIWKAAIAALCFGALAGCQPYDGYDQDGYYGGGYNYSGGYCDSWGCPDDYWDRPVYYGSVYYGGSWVNGPFYYRDWNGGRQYWVRGGWRHDGWRGDRPSQYRNFRHGPALGRDWYRHNRSDGDGRPGFQGRGGYGPDNDNRPGFGPGAGQGRGGDGASGRGRGGFDGGGRDGGGRGNRGAQQQDQPQRQTQPPQNNDGGRFGDRGFQRMDSAPRGSSDGRALTPPDRRFGRDGSASPPPPSP